MRTLQQCWSPIILDHHAMRSQTSPCLGHVQWPPGITNMWQASCTQVHPALDTAHLLPAEKGWMFRNSCTLYVSLHNKKLMVVFLSLVFNTVCRSLILRREHVVLIHKEAFKETVYYIGVKVLLNQQGNSLNGPWWLSIEWWSGTWMLRKELIVLQEHSCYWIAMYLKAKHLSGLDKSVGPVGTCKL